MPTKLRMPPIDVPLALAALGLIAIGLLIVYSATSIPGAHQGLWAKQLMWALVAVGAAALVAAIDHRVYDSAAWPLYGLSLLMLMAVLIFGTSTLGAKRWLDLGPIKFQPSELAKIATVLVLARRFDDPKIKLSRWPHWLPATLLVLVPFALVLKEPDLGTALSFPAILIAMLYWGGMPLRQIILGLTPAFNAALFFLTGTLWWFGGLFVALLFIFRPRLPVLIVLILLNGGVAWATPHLWNHMHDYQKRRIETFLNPDHDPSGAGYQIILRRSPWDPVASRARGISRGRRRRWRSCRCVTRTSFIPWWARNWVCSAR